MNEKRDRIEKEFLTILYEKPDIGFDLLQIKPKYLEIKNNQILFEMMLQSYEKYDIVDYSYIFDNANNTIVDLFTEISSREYLPLLDIRKQFLICQTSILDYYKKKVISNLTNQLNEEKINCSDYLSKMQKIERINIQINGKPLTIEEIDKNIDTSRTRIPLNNYPKLSKILELVQGDFLVIGASTGTGKSGLMLNLMNSLMNDYQCIYFNMEMSKSTIYKRMLSIQADVPVKYINSPETDYQADLIRAAKFEIEKNKIIVEHESVYFEDIEDFLKAVKNEENKHTIIFLDHIGLIRLKGTSKNIYEQTTDVVKKLRQLCLKYDCTIIGACQLNRASYGINELNISMLKDSGEIENSASKIILLYRNKDFAADHLEPEMILDICKNRDGMNGQIVCKYFKTKQIFKEI